MCVIWGGGRGAISVLFNFSRCPGLQCRLLPLSLSLDWPQYPGYLEMGSISIILISASDVTVSDTNKTIQYYHVNSLSLWNILITITNCNVVSHLCLIHLYRKYYLINTQYYLIYFDDIHIKKFSPSMEKSVWCMSEDKNITILACDLIPCIQPKHVDWRENPCSLNISVAR